MAAPNKDRSKSRIVRMPKFHDTSLVVDFWFELGMIYFQDPRDPNKYAACTVNDLEERIDALRGFVDDDELCSQFVCGKQAARRFICDITELIREAKQQLHVGLPIETISEIERERAAISRRQGFGPELSVAETPGRSFLERASGLLVPVS